MIQNEYYELKFDKEKKRYYSKLKGFWNDPKIGDAYLEDVKKLGNGIKPFTLVQDLTEFKAPSQEVGPKLVEIQEWLFNNDLTLAAEILSSAITKMSVTRIGRTSGIDVVKKQFNSFREAEKWLNEAS
ncbi:MAG: hypothetical protein ACXAC7_18875 [Candidatus Hodarchaeales archaeon]|jgi:hypothetical protein